MHVTEDIVQFSLVTQSSDSRFLESGHFRKGRLNCAEVLGRVKLDSLDEIAVVRIQCQQGGNGQSFSLQP